MSKKIQASFLTSELAKLFDEYHSEVTAAMKEAVPEVSEKAKEQVKNNAPVGARKGKYKKGITVRKISESNTFIEYSIWAGKEGYRLSHLLEHGHLNANGTARTKAVPHFKFGEDYADQHLIPEIVKKLGG